MQIINPCNNCVFVIDDDHVCHCFSYGQEVAEIRDNTYTEFMGDRYYSRTSNKHKAMFRNHFNVL